LHAAEAGLDLKDPCIAWSDPSDEIAIDNDAVGAASIHATAALTPNLKPRSGHRLKVAATARRRPW